jgi:DNA-binding MarR family transcriptional regulator
MASQYTPRQGQCFAFIYYYQKLKHRPPAEADIQRYFGISGAAVHHMIVTLEKHGFLERVPGQARSLRLLMPRADLPDLE